MNHSTRAKEVIALEIKGLQDVRGSLGGAFNKAVELMLQRLKDGRKIVVTGVGKNLHIAQKIAATLTSTGSTSVTLNPSQAMHGDLGVLSDGDVLLALSYSGASDELLDLLPVARRMGVSIVLMTGAADSPASQLSDIVIPVAVEREACPFNLAPTTSTTAALAVGDALAVVLLEAQGFKRDDYARLHPGGTIGRTLLLRACDIMRSGSRCASVRDTAKVRDAILAMTRARSGSAAVVDARNRVVGIFTDGDLRRHITEHPNLVSLPVRKVMTSNPVTVRSDAPAVDVLRTFETHNIDDLVVVDAKGRLAGAVDIQDLPKLKIM